MPKLVRHILKGLLIAGAIVGVILFIAQDQETLRLRSELAADDPRALPYLTALVGAATTSGNNYAILNNGDEIFPVMLAAINGAKKRISFETYIYEKGSIGDQFTDALEAAARRGVAVTMVVDSMGSGSMSGDDTRRLTEAGGRVEAFNATDWWELEEVNYRTHRKILVVDGEVAFTGGVGIADHWLGHAQDIDHWRDLQVMMSGPIVRLMEGAFYENFAEAAEEGAVVPVLEEESSAPAEPNALIVRSSPSGGSSDLKRLYLLLIAMARRRIDIQSPYFIADASTRWAIEEAVARGVTVRIVTESDMTDAAPVKYASRAAYESFLAKGIQVYEYQPTMMHAKVMTVDDTWSMFGSANFDNRSLELNDELNVAVRSPELAARFAANFERDLTASKQLRIEEWRHRPLVEKTREHFWKRFGELF